MSLRAMLWAMDDAPDHLTPTQRHVLLVLADHVNDETLGAYPSISRLSRRTGLSERTVQRCLRTLEDLGIIRIDVQAARGSHDRPIPHDRRPNLYLWTAYESRPQTAPTYAQGCHTVTPTPVTVSPRGVSQCHPNPNRNPNKNLLLEAEVVEALRLRLPDAPTWIGKRAQAALDRGWTVSGIVDAITAETTDGSRSPWAVLASRLDDLGTRDPKHPTRLRPTWCGQCDEASRHIDVGTGVTRCPDCHPVSVRSAS